MPKFKVGDRVKSVRDIEFKGKTLVNGAEGWVMEEVHNDQSNFALYVSFGECFERVPVRTYEIAMIEEEANVPNYYLLPTGIQVIDVTRWLTGNAAQAVQYIARSSRVDEVYKGDRVKDLRKALDFINDEIERLELDDE